MWLLFMPLSLCVCFSSCIFLSPLTKALSNLHELCLIASYYSQLLFPMRPQSCNSSSFVSFHSQFQQTVYLKSRQNLMMLFSFSSSVAYGFAALGQEAHLKTNQLYKACYIYIFIYNKMDLIKNYPFSIS